VRIGGGGPWNRAGQAQPPHVTDVIAYAHPDGP
jgi:hypothetical protein